MIKLQVIGHLGRDAVVKEVGDTKVINFSVAHTESFKNKSGEKTERTVWVECAKWGDNTAVAAYLLKGTQVFAEGTPEVRTFEKNDGGTGASLVLRVIGLSLLGGGKQKEAGGKTKETAEAAAPNGQAVDDDLPF
jgi:single-strand DNA-binding protein